MKKLFIYAWASMTNAIMWLYHTCLTLRIVVFAAVFGYFIFSTPDQIQEIYLIYASDASEHLVQIGFFTCFAILLVLLLEQCAHHAWMGTSNSISRSNAFISRLVSVAPLIGIALGVNGSAQYFDMPDLKAVFTHLAEQPLTPDSATYLDKLTGNFAALHESSLGTISALEWIGFFVVNCTTIFVLLSLMARTRSKSQILFAWLVDHVFIITFIFTILISLQTMSGLGGLPVFLLRASALLGTLTWVALFLILLLLFLSRLQYASRGAGIYLTALLIGLALFFDWEGLNDNHTVRTVPSHQQRDTFLLSQEFGAWWDRRPKERVKAFTSRGMPFPVYIVAARGGGLYAAFQTGIALARLYDSCPAVIDHIFLISSVSGGSLGAAVFDAAVHATPPAGNQKCVTSDTKPGQIETLVDRFFSYDFLSPLAAMALFPDFSQRFLPYPIPAFDRARAFERALEYAWRSATNGSSDAFSMGISEQHTLGDGPLLFMNVTQAETGEQLVMAPTSDTIQEGRSGVTSAYPSIAGPLTGTDIALSTAAVLSARFPLIMPAGSAETTADSWSLWPKVGTRYVDGGYFENSGADTAADVIRWLELDMPARQIPAPGAKDKRTFPEYSFKTIVLGHHAYYDRLYEGAEYTPNGFAEIGTPIDALMQTREVRGDRAVERLKPDFEINLNHRFFKFPLGWQLSSTTRRLIAANVSRAAACNDPARAALADWLGGPNGVPSGPTGFVESFQENACAQCKIIRETSKGFTPRISEKRDEEVDFCE